jgi:hypothetical protein
MFFNEKIRDAKNEIKSSVSGRFPWRSDGNSYFDFVPLISNYIYDGRLIPKINHVKFNGPATIIFWEDGSKTVVKVAYEEFDPEKGIAMAIAKRAMGNKGNYNNEISKWASTYEEESGDDIWKPFAPEETFEYEICDFNKENELSNEELHEIIDNNSIDEAVNLIEERIGVRKRGING